MPARSQKPLRKVIPGSGQRIPVMGVGTMNFGRCDPATVGALVRALRESGGAVIDTAAGYDGSEVLIGEALRQQRLLDDVFIATKFTPHGNDQDPVGGLPSFERSLRRLGRVDVLFAHRVDGLPDLMPVMQQLKVQRRVRYIGFTSMYPPEYPRVLEYLRTGVFDFLQINYAIGDRFANDEVLPAAQEHKVAVMVATPLAGPTLLLPLTQGRALPPWAADLGVTSWGQFMLKYVVSHPAVTCAIPGATSLAHLADDQQAGRGVLPDAALRRKMEVFWDQHIQRWRRDDAWWMHPESFR
jgi:aryl-alcohol dehydrogenase-like predicted oxidoreductase